MSAASSPWPRVPISKVAIIASGNSIPAADRRGKFSSAKVAGRPFISTKDVSLDGWVDMNTEVAIPEAHSASFRVAPAGSTLVCAEGGSAGRKVGWLPESAHFGNKLFAVSASRDIYPRFLFYFHQTDDFAGQFAGHLAGLIGGVSLKKFKTIEIPVPPLEEQKRIVAVLDQAFAALDRARALAEANLADAEELFDGWLTAVFHDHPAEWATRKLRDLCHQITVGHVGPMADRYSSDGTPFLRSQNVRPFRIDLADVKFIDDAFRSELKKSELRPGDVAIVRTGYPGTAAVIPDDLPLANCADLVIARPKDELHPEFLAMFLNSSFGKKMVAEKSVGAAQKHFNVGAAKEVDFAYPRLEDQLTIVNQMKAMRGYSARLYDQCQAKIDELQELRQALLRQAFAGELT